MVRLIATVQKPINASPMVTANGQCVPSVKLYAKVYARALLRASAVEKFMESIHIGCPSLRTESAVMGIAAVFAIGRAMLIQKNVVYRCRLVTRAPVSHNLLYERTVGTSNLRNVSIVLTVFIFSG